MKNFSSQCLICTRMRRQVRMVLILDFIEKIGIRLVRRLLMPIGAGWRGEELSAQIHESTIVLFPKVQSPQSMKELRPISLCNVLYMLVAKVLANRFRKIQ
ncbi:hypothetical protein LINPERHAP1_LOCUS36823 [Linum perenne]